MTVEQAISDISTLSIDEQLRVVQAIWDALPQHVGTELTVAQKAELDRRWKSYEANPELALSQEGFRQQINAAKK